MKKTVIHLTMVLALLLTACGQKGALYLPQDTTLTDSQTTNSEPITSDEIDAILTDPENY